MFVFISIPLVLDFSAINYKKHFDLLTCFKKRKIIQWLYMLIMKYVLNSYTLKVKTIPVSILEIKILFFGYK